MKPARSERDRNVAVALAKILRHKFDPEQVKILNMPILAAVTNATV